MLAGMSGRYVLVGGVRFAKMMSACYYLNVPNSIVNSNLARQIIKLGQRRRLSCLK